MFYREIIAVCFEIHTKHINTSTLYGQIVELLTLNLVVRIVTIGLKTVKIRSNLLLQPSLYKQLLKFFFHFDPIKQGRHYNSLHFIYIP